MKHKQYSNWLNFNQANYLILIFLSIASLLSCTSKPVPSFQENSLEQFRPGYHFTPAKGWMNDPNGLVYIDGEYHLFFQHNPDSTVWGPMHWGHAVSKDLVTWEELPIALFPDSLGTIFSGSAVYDAENSSELGTKDNPPLVAIFTYHNALQEKAGAVDFQTQGIAYSVDKGKTWSKYEGNPVLLNPGIRDFRDPKVTQISKANGTKAWLMTLAVRIEFSFTSLPT